MENIERETLYFDYYCLWCYIVYRVQGRTELAEHGYEQEPVE